jgi:ribosomal protein L20
VINYAIQQQSRHASRLREHDPAKTLNTLEHLMRNQIITKINGQLETATANYTSTNDKVLDAVIDANRKAVDFAVKTVDAITKVVEVPTMVELPFAGRFELAEFPTAAEAGKRYISFVERAADMNRDLHGRVIEMLKIEEAKPAAKKPAVKKPAVKKPAVKKPAVKKPVAKKPVAKKPAADATK